MSELFADFQSLIRDMWKRNKKPVDPTKQRKKQLCPKCGKQGYKVKMDYLGNKHEKYKATVYDVSYFKCPRCSFVDRVFARIEGRGEKGANAGRMFGGI